MACWTETNQSIFESQILTTLELLAGVHVFCTHFRQPSMHQTTAQVEVGSTSVTLNPPVKVRVLIRATQTTVLVGLQLHHINTWNFAHRTSPPQAVQCILIRISVRVWRAHLQWMTLELSMTLTLTLTLAEEVKHTRLTTRT